MSDYHQHSGDCTIYRSLVNGRPVDGICTCGYGWTRVRQGDWSEMYSQERLPTRSIEQQTKGATKMTDTAKLRAGIVTRTIPSGDFIEDDHTEYCPEATKALMREAADEIEELRRQVAELSAHTEKANRIMPSIHYEPSGL